MLNRSASLTMSTSVLEALPGKLDIKRHSPSILYILANSADSDGILHSASYAHNALNKKNISACCKKIIRSLSKEAGFAEA